MIQVTKQIYKFFSAFLLLCRLVLPDKQSCWIGDKAKLYDY